MFFCVSWANRGRIAHAFLTNNIHKCSISVMLTSQPTVVVAVRGEHTAPTVYNHFPCVSSVVIGLVQTLCGTGFLILSIVFIAYAQQTDDASFGIAVWVKSILRYRLIVIHSSASSYRPNVCLAGTVTVCDRLHATVGRWVDASVGCSPQYLLVN